MKMLDDLDGFFFYSWLIQTHNKSHRSRERETKELLNKYIRIKFGHAFQTDDGAPLHETFSMIFWLYFSDVPIDAATRAAGFESSNKRNSFWLPRCQNNCRELIVEFMIRESLWEMEETK